MKLNPDCIRDLLLAVEEYTDKETYLDYPSKEADQYLSEYPSNEVRYHIEQCYLAGLILEVDEDLSGNCSVSYLTPNGHEFVANIRTDKHWNKTKEIAKEIGSSSLSTLIQVAAQVISNLITNYR